MRGNNTAVVQLGRYLAHVRADVRVAAVAQLNESWIAGPACLAESQEGGGPCHQLGSAGGEPVEQLHGGLAGEHRRPRVALRGWQAA